MLLALALLCPAAVPLLAQSADVDPASFTLRPGDALEVEIWREEEMSGEFIVNESGVVTLPLLGPVEAAGTPIGELREELIARFQVELRNPSITITPLRRIYVLGEVNDPGLFEVDPTITLAGAVAMAGGANREGDLSRMTIMRDGEILFSRVEPQTDLLSIDIRSGDQIFVDRRSWFDRNSAFLVSATIGVAGIVVQLLR